MRKTKPTIGMLVKPSKALGDMYIDDAQALMYLCDIGLVTDCIGIRCKVQWQAGHVTTVLRGDLEVISDGQ